MMSALHESCRREDPGYALRDAHTGSCEYGELAARLRESRKMCYRDGFDGLEVEF